MPKPHTPLLLVVPLTARGVQVKKPRRAQRSPEAREESDHR